MRLLVDPYVECVARVRMLERGLLTRADLEQALGRTSGAQVLSDARFFPSAAGGGREAALVKARENNYALLVSLTYGAPVVEVFRYPADVHALRSALKSRLTGRQTSPPSAAVPGVLPEEGVSDLAEGRPAEGVPEALVEAVERALSLWEAEAELAAVDRALDEGQLAWQRDVARRLRCSFLSSYFALVADLANLRSVLRAKAAGWPPEKASSLLLRGEEMERGRVARAAADEGAWKELLSGTSYEAFLRVGQDMDAMEAESERIRMRFLRSTREALEGIEPLLAFYLARERDVATLEVVASGLDSGMPAEAIRRRVGPTWWEC